MSLNRAEQTIADYLARQPDERRHWQDKVVRLAAASAGPHAAADAVTDALVAYCRERAAVVADFRGLDTLPRMMLRNLAELLLCQWGPPPPKRKTSAEPRP